MIGKRARHLTEAEALACVLGYTIGNDVSERTWQKSDRTLWRAKNADTFKPMGPWIETDVDLERWRRACASTARRPRASSTNAMLFGVATYIATISRYITLYPGDVIWMGTDGSLARPEARATSSRSRSPASAPCAIPSLPPRSAEHTLSATQDGHGQPRRAAPTVELQN